MRARSRFVHLLATLLIGASPAAQALPTLSFSVDGGPALICADGDACDGDLTPGIVHFDDALDAFVVNISIGSTKPALGGLNLMDLGSLNLQSVAGPHTLEIMFSEVGFLPSGGFELLIGGTLTAPAGSTIDASAFDGAGLFDAANLIGSFGFGPGAFVGIMPGAGPGASPYSLTQVLSLSTTGPASMSVDFAVNALAAPEPGTLALLALGLAGLAATGRRKR